MKILGISCYYHDSAAALIDNGKLIAAAQEERFSRKKHDANFPILAINFCLQKAGISAKELDYAVFYEKPFKKFERIILSFLATVPGAYELFYQSYQGWLREKLWIKETIAKTLKIPTNKILFSEHHLSHAASAFYTSPFKRAAILTADAVGEWSTTTWGIGVDRKIRLTNETTFPHSLGLFYSTFTQFLGFEINEGEYKVMGLAAYGKPIYRTKVKKLIKQAKDGSFILNMDYFSFHISTTLSFNEQFIKLLGVPPNDQPEVIRKPYTDIAASVQTVLDDILVAIVKNMRRKTGEENLCMAGGVALNGISNWKIYKESGFKNLFIHPAAGDAGGALGAALYLYHHVLDKRRKIKWNSPFWGHQQKPSDIERFLKNKGIPYIKLSQEKLIDMVVDKLINGKVVGWVQGRFEWGPRALGGRSILADPRSKKMKELVNSKIKFREGFRPFAPVVLFEEASKFFDIGDAQDQLPFEYMLFVVPVKKSKRALLGAVTHVDGTSRPQFIKRGVQKNYYELVKKFGEKTGIPVLLNTSFNLKGEPIVNTVQDAYETFIRSGLDLLVLENFLIRKEDLNIKEV